MFRVAPSVEKKKRGKISSTRTRTKISSGSANANSKKALCSSPSEEHLEVRRERDILQSAAISRVRGAVRHRRVSCAPLLFLSQVVIAADTPSCLPVCACPFALARLCAAYQVRGVFVRGTWQVHTVISSAYVRSGCRPSPPSRALAISCLHGVK